jgi:hypothetical protein
MVAALLVQAAGPSKEIDGERATVIAAISPSSFDRFLACAE